MLRLSAFLAPFLARLDPLLARLRMTKPAAEAAAAAPADAGADAISAAPNPQEILARIFREARHLDFPRVARDALIISLMMIGALILAISFLGAPAPVAEGIVLRLDAEGETAAHGATTETKAPLIGDPALAEETKSGFLPRISADGRKPEETYARLPIASDGKPAISIVIAGLGLSRGATAEALRNLPAEVTLALNPYSRDLAALADAARRKGHEYLLELPIEPFDYPENDSGPLTLLADMPPGELERRLHDTLARSGGYFGLLTAGRSRFATDEAALRLLAGHAAARGLALLDDGGAPISKTARISRGAGVSTGTVDRRLDERPTAENLALRFIEIERLALEKGRAIAIADASPKTLASIRAWTESFAAKGLVLVPVSSQIVARGAAGAGPPSPEEGKRGHEEHAQDGH